MAGEPLWNQALAGLGGPPDRALRLAGGRILLAACRPQSCTEKTGVLAEKGRIVAVGLLQSRCTPRCGSDARLSVFARRADLTQARAPLAAWARAKLSNRKVEILLRSL